MGQRALWRRWVMLVTLGELAGFTVPAMAGVWSSSMPSGAQLAVLTSAGLFEGALLGAVQAIVLRRTLPGFRARAWVAATSLAAAVAWFLGMLPSTTHGTWSHWPVGWTVAVAALLGTALLCTIGTAQALVMPRGTRGAHTWVAWTALGWCAGLAAFGVVAPPLWHSGQATWATLLVGLAGGVAMALAMAAVTGVGAARLVARAHGRESNALGQRAPQVLSGLLGTLVYDESGQRLGRIRDVVVDLAAGLERVPVTRLVIRTSGTEAAVAPWRDVGSGGADQQVVLRTQPEPFTETSLGPTDLLVRRDILDTPVVTADPPRRTRVGDVVLEIAPTGAWVTGIDPTPAGALSRLLRRTSSGDRPTVPLSRVHLLSRRGHAAQLAVPDAMVLGLSPEAMAEVLTRVPVSHARDIMRAIDQSVTEEAVRLLHPHVRARVTGSDGPPRRTRRLSGWRLHRPGTGHRPGGRG